MIQLYKLEFGKLVRRASCIAGLLLLLLTAAEVYGKYVDPFGSSLYVIDKDGTILHGRAAIRLNRETVERYGGVLTDERVEEILRYFKLNEQQLEALLQDENSDGVESPYADLLIFCYFKEAQTFTVNRDGREETHTIVETFDGEIPMRRIADVFPESVLPLRMEYSLPWTDMMESMILVLFRLGLLMLLLVAPVFSDERMRRMNALLFTSQMGKRKCFWAKAAVAYSMGIVLAAAVVLLHVLITRFAFGSSGLSGSIQIGNLSGTYQNLLCVKTVGACILEAAWLYTADVIFMVSITVLGSVLASNLLTSAVVSAVMWAVPVVLTFWNGIPEAVRLTAPVVHRMKFTRILSQPDVVIGSITVPYSYAAGGILLLLSGLILICAAWLYGHVAGE